jgi:hydroxymethylglutaryl-CoA reductase
MDKLNFVENEFPKLLENLTPEQRGAWGNMNAIQMVEHMAESVSYATGKNPQKLHTPAEHVSKYKEFAMSDKEFKENTKNALMSETPPAVKRASLQEAIDDYKEQLQAFKDYFLKNPGASLTNSFFGDLNYEEWIHLFHKHATHHAKQFGLLK